METKDLIQNVVEYVEDPIDLYNLTFTNHQVSNIGQLKLDQLEKVQKIRSRHNNRGSWMHCEFNGLDYSAEDEWDELPDYQPLYITLSELRTLDDSSVRNQVPYFGASCFYMNDLCGFIWCLYHLTQKYKQDCFQTLWELIPKILEERKFVASVLGKDCQENELQNISVSEEGFHDTLDGIFLMYDTLEGFDINVKDLAKVDMSFDGVGYSDITSFMIYQRIKTSLSL